MSPKESPESKPVVTRNSSEFKLDLYASIPQEELVVFAVQVLQADGSPAQSEDIVSTCFRFFPHSFALKNYFYWPDSALVARRLQEAREKGLLKGNPADGFEVKVQGRKAAKVTAKALGVSFPTPPRVEEPAAPVVETPVIDKKEEAEAQVKNTQLAAGDGGRSKVGKKKEEAEAQVKSAQPAAGDGGKSKAGKKVVKKQRTKPAVKAVKPKAKKAVAKKPVRKVKPGKAKAQKRETQIAKKMKAGALKRETQIAKRVKAQRRETQSAKKIKAKAKPRKPASQKAFKAKVAQRMSGITPVPAKAKVEKRAMRKAKAQKIKTQNVKTQIGRAKQLTLGLVPAPAKKKAQVPATKPQVREEAHPAVDKKQVITKSPMGKKSAPLPISKEEREKAAKVVKQVERSDAFRHYKKNGRKAHISEFEFRDMLFTTMETSPETLKRNVDAFKRYAGIRERADLTTFLEFCEERFSALLISKAKVKGKR